MVKISFADFEEDARAEGALDLRISDAAAARLHEIFQKPAYIDKNMVLRLNVKGGGCNGYSYHFKMEARPAEIHDDVELGHEKYPDVKVLLNQPSAKLLRGSTLDFEDTLEARQFIIKNPNAKTSCGCGNSFSV